jgi:hypothetical protein
VLDVEVWAERRHGGRCRKNASLRKGADRGRTNSMRARGSTSLHVSGGASAACLGWEEDTPDAVSSGGGTRKFKSGRLGMSQAKGGKGGGGTGLAVRR